MPCSSFPLIFSPAPPLGPILSAASAKGPLCEAARASCRVTFCALPLHLFLALLCHLFPCFPLWGLVRWGRPSRAMVGLRSTGCLGVWGLEFGSAWRDIPCPCWRLPSSPAVEKQLFFVKVNLLPVNTGNVVHVCSVCV